MATLAVRDIVSSDIDPIVSYWLDGKPEFFENMGAAPARFPSRPEFVSTLQQRMTQDQATAKNTVLMWTVDGKAMGFNTLKNIVRGGTADMHLHIFDVAYRGKGYGGPLFCLAALEFYRRYDLQSIICEPRSTNPMPNGMLRKVGFPLTKTYVGCSSEMSLTCELNRYDIHKDIAEQYLRTQGLI